MVFFTSSLRELSNFLRPRVCIKPKFRLKIPKSVTITAQATMLFSPRYFKLGTIIPRNVPWLWQQGTVIPQWAPSLGIRASLIRWCPFSLFPLWDNYCQLWLTLTSIRHVFPFGDITAWWQFSQKTSKHLRRNVGPSNGGRENTAQGGLF